MNHNLLIYLLAVCLLTPSAFCSAANEQTAVFSIESTSTQSVVGAPILLKLTLQNPQKEDYTIKGEPGWGRDLSILCAQGGAPFQWLAPNVQRMETEAGYVYRPTYSFAGRLGSDKSQCLLQLIQIQDARPGSLRLKAVLNQGILLNSEEVVVSLVEAEETQTNRALTAVQKRLLYREVSRFHNRFGYRRSSDLGPIIEKAKASSETTVETEYALYAGVLQGISGDATNEDRALAKESAKAFLVHRKEGDTEAAELALKAGQALPESYPLFQNLGLVEEPVAPEDKN